MKLPSLFALDARHRAIGRPHVGSSVQRYLDGKGRRPPTSKDLNAGDGLATGPLPNGLEALFPESHIVYADCVGFHHADRTRAERHYAPAALLSKSNAPYLRLRATRWRPWSSMAGCAPVVLTKPYRKADLARRLREVVSVSELLSPSHAEAPAAPMTEVETTKR